MKCAHGKNPDLFNMSHPPKILFFFWVILFASDTTMKPSFIFLIIKLERTGTGECWFMNKFIVLKTQKQTKGHGGVIKLIFQAIFKNAFILVFLRRQRFNMEFMLATLLCSKLKS